MVIEVRHVLGQRAGDGWGGVASRRDLPYVVFVRRPTPRTRAGHRGLVVGTVAGSTP
jgi:hypothetical protein